MKAVKETIRKYYKYGNNYIDTNYIPLMTSTTLPSGSVINTGSLDLHGNRTSYGAWGKNQTKSQEWTSNDNISTSYIPALNIPSGHYKLNFQLANYGKWSTWLTVKFTLTYSDDTTEDTYTASSGFPPVRSDDQVVYFDYSHEFIASKPIKSIKFSGTSQIGNEGSGFVRSIYIQEAEIIETTEQDYDFYKDVPIYKLIYSGKKQVPYSIEYNNNVIPAMISNTEPYNTVTVISGSLYSSGSQWRGFGNPSAGTIEPSSNSATIRYSFETPIPQGDYNLIFWYSNDTPKYGTATFQNRKLYSYSVTLNCSDNTTEIVSSWNGTLTNTYKFVDYFKAGKEIKSIDFAFTGDASGENLVLGCIYDIQLYEGEIIYKELDTYKAPRSWEKGQYYGN